ELQAGRGGLCALANQIEREIAVLGLWIVVEDLKPIDDRADRTDEIVANPRTQQRGQLEGIGSGTGRRSARHRLFLESRDRRGGVRITHASRFDTLRRRGRPARGGRDMGTPTAREPY